MADYNYIVKSIFNAKPKYNVSFDRLNRTVNIGGVGYSGGSLSRAFKSSGSSSDIMNNFFKANKDPQKTKREVEKISKGKIKVSVGKGYGNEPIVYYTLNEDVVDDVAYVVKTYEKPKTRKLLTIMVINKLKEKRNNSKSSSNKQKLQKIIDKLEKDYQKGKFMKENINEAIGMSQSDRNKIYHKLNKGDKVRIKFGNAIRKGNEGEFIVSKGKTKVGKQRVERITLKNVKNPSGVKYYLYNRNNNIGMAQGDMGAVIEDMEIVKESVNERYRPNLDSKGWEAAQKVIRQLQSSVFRKLDDDELLEFRKAIADAFNLDGVLKEATINERRGGMDIIRRIVKNHQYEGGVDVQTANMILKVYDKVDDKTKKFLDHATLKQIVGLIIKARR
jgi:hypothetical protein